MTEFKRKILSDLARVLTEDIKPSDDDYIGNDITDSGIRQLENILGRLQGLFEAEQEGK